MTVKELIEKLQKCNPDADVGVSMMEAHGVVTIARTLCHGTSEHGEVITIDYDESDGIFRNPDGEASLDLEVVR